MTQYYVDTCIWLNLLNREQSKVQGLPVWKIAELFITQHETQIFISSFVIREVEHKYLGPQEHILILKRHATIIQTTEQELKLARDIEDKELYNLSFYDCIHLAIAKTRGYTLITRDKELLERGEKYAPTIKPEILIY